MSARRPLVAAAVLLTLTACSPEEAAGPQTQGSPPSESAPRTASETTPGERTPSATGSPTDEDQTSAPLRPRVAGVVARNLEVPWGIDFLPDGSALVTERDSATIRRISPGGKVSRVGSVSNVQPVGEGGLLGLAVSPTYARDHRIYVYFTSGRDNRVVTMTYEGGSLGRQRPVLTGIPFGQIHDGGRLEFGPDGKLYVSTGETGDPSLAQDKSSLGGKILRLNPDGSVPDDNPFGSPVWTLGHRNVQGLAFDDDDRLWASEFGSDVWDELNRIRKGRNYGWPAVEGKESRDRFTPPLVQWRPDNASPSGLDYAGGSLWAASLNGERLWRVPVRDDGGTGRPRPLLRNEYGRLRTVVTAPDGSLWVATSNRDGRGSPAPPDDRIVRVVLR